jgi:hypothetical protein
MEEDLMSLLGESMTDCAIVDKDRVSDGEGGSRTDWAEGEKFMAAIILDASMEARRAEKIGVTSLYTITTAKNVKLKPHDIFKRLSDGKCFRVTSDGTDKHTPGSANLDMRQVTAKEYELPDGGET